MKILRKLENVSIEEKIILEFEFLKKKYRITQLEVFEKYTRICIPDLTYCLCYTSRIEMENIVRFS